MKKDDKKIEMELTPENMLFLARVSLELLQDYRSEQKKEKEKQLIKTKNNK